MGQESFRPVQNTYISVIYFFLINMLTFLTSKLFIIIFFSLQLFIIKSN